MARVAKRKLKIQEAEVKVFKFHSCFRSDDKQPTGYVAPTTYETHPR